MFHSKLKFLEIKSSERSPIHNIVELNNQRMGRFKIVDIL